MKTFISALLLTFCLIPSVSAFEIDPTIPVPSQRTRREIVEKTQNQKRTPTPKTIDTSSVKSEEKQGVEHEGYALDVVYDDSDYYTFGAQIDIENRDTGETIRYITKSGGTAPILKPGRYSAYTQASRKGFPQEAKYQIVDVLSGNIIEEFPRTHVPVNNVVIEAGQKLRIVVLPATRPYNSVFFRVGKLRTPVAIIFNRPYPSYDFEPGDFTGSSQFSSTQIAIAFWGMKEAIRQSELATRIRTEGVPGLRNGEQGKIKDPVLVLGIRTVARDLARTFIQERSKNTEDYRGQFHISFLIQRTDAGRVPRSLLTITEEELTADIEKQILWLEQHNVHRAEEGGGYAGKTFLDVMEEAKTKAMEWPRLSVQSTEIQRTWVGELETLGATIGLDSTVTLDNGHTNTVRRFLVEEITNTIRAIRRERMNYDTYETEWLKDAVQTMKMPLVTRIEDLKFTEKLLLDRLHVLDATVTTVDGK